VAGDFILDPRQRLPVVHLLLGDHRAQCNIFIWGRSPWWLKSMNIITFYLVL
jgi:hypothetical protein